jgi:primosomal protein N' (replication factor Y)
MAEVSGAAAGEFVEVLGSGPGSPPDTLLGSPPDSLWGSPGSPVGSPSGSLLGPPVGSREGRPGGVEILGPSDGRWLVRADDHATLCDALAAVRRPPGRLRIAVDPPRI